MLPHVTRPCVVRRPVSRLPGRDGSHFQAVHAGMATVQDIWRIHACGVQGLDKLPIDVVRSRCISQRAVEAGRWRKVGALHRHFEHS